MEFVIVSVQLVAIKEWVVEYRMSRKSDMFPKKSNFSFRRHPRAPKVTFFEQWQFFRMGVPDMTSILLRHSQIERTEEENQR